MELKQALPGTSNNANGRDLVPPGVPANQMAQRVNNNTIRGEVGFEGAGGTGRISCNDNRNDPFKTELMRFMREMNKQMDRNTKEFHTRMDQILGAPPVLKGPDSKKYTQLPFKSSAAPELIPKRFKMSDIPKYDGTLDPQEHITIYTTVVKWNDLAQHDIESVLLKKFGESFTKGDLTWYSLLPEHSIDSFEMPTNSSVKAHAETRKVQDRKDIFTIAQGESEFLGDFVIRFQKESMMLPVVPDEWEIEAFIKGLNPRNFDASRKLKESPLKFQATTWANRIEGCGNKGFWSSERFGVDRRTDHGRNNRSLQEKEVLGAQNSTYLRLSDYYFNISIVELVSVIRNIKEARFLKPIRSDPSQRDPNLWCEYHGTHDHKTGDFRHLREEVATLLKNGHLREFLSDRAKNNFGRSRDNAEPLKIENDYPWLTINMIFRGNKINGVTFSVAKKTRISVTHNKRLQGVAKDDITFMEEDADELLLPHNDALVISLNVLDLKIKRVFIDLGSSRKNIQ
uniref:Uncharacterized protein n=1 Tax=Nicotiana tabacum TaxID=4097 RepID=A0A1S3YSH1_TOBAC|nr:PREDICTED: uncharacterized protein LOC107779289 [Nicotiana tabacum]